MTDEKNCEECVKHLAVLTIIGPCPCGFVNMSLSQKGIAILLAQGEVELCCKNCGTTTTRKLASEDFAEAFLSSLLPVGNEVIRQEDEGQKCQSH